MDLEIRKFEEGLVAHINHSDLPIEIIRLIVQEVCEKVTKAANEEIYKQQQREGAEKRNAVKKQGGEKNAKSIQPDVLGKQTE